jgi:hypothetical protein
LIFVICLLVATLLIGLGMGKVIKFKQNISSNFVNEPQQPCSCLAGYLPVFTNSRSSSVRRVSAVLIEYTSDV